MAQMLEGCMYNNFIYEQTKILYGIPKQLRCNKFQLFGLMQLEGKNNKKYTLQIRVIKVETLLHYSRIPKLFMSPNSKVLGLMLLHKYALRHELILASFCSCYDYQGLVKRKLQLKQFIHSIPRIDVLLFVVTQHGTNISFVSNLGANSCDI
jgi:hypothetical protein